MMRHLRVAKCVNAENALAERGFESQIGTEYAQTSFCTEGVVNSNVVPENDRPLGYEMPRETVEWSTQTSTHDDDLRPADCQERAATGTTCQLKPSSFFIQLSCAKDLNGLLVHPG